MKTKKSFNLKLVEVISVLILLVLASAMSIATTGIVNNAGTQTNVYFVGTSTNPAQRYQDAIDPNPDLGLELCGQGATSYIGAVYAFNKSGTWNYSLITYGTDANNALSLTALKSGDCYSTANVSMGSLTISPSHLSSRTPEVFVAAFPGRIFVINSSSQDGSSPTFIPVTASTLLGSYSVTSSFSESSQNVTVTGPTITFQTNSGTFSKTYSDSNYGVNNDRRMAVALCTDDQGSNCNDGVILNDSSRYPLQLASGVVPSEATTFTRYVVINGLGSSICIGPDINTNNLLLNDSSVFSGESINISFATSNSQNVNVTSSFKVGIFVDSENVQNFTINGLGSGLSTTNSLSYNTINLGSGNHNIKSVTFDSLGDCSSTNDNKTATLTVSKTYKPTVLIDGIETNNFTYAGKPYNLTIKINDSDGNLVSNVKINLIETNGLNLFAPMQIFNQSGNGLKPLSTAIIYTNNSGEVSFALIPTGNKMYESAYQSYNVSGYVGNYSLYFEIFNATTGTEMQMAVAGQGLVGQFDFNLLNMTVYSPNSSQIGTVRVNNQNQFVQQMIEYVDQAFAVAYKWLDII